MRKLWGKSDGAREKYIMQKGFTIIHCQLRQVVIQTHWVLANRKVVRGH